MDKRVNIYLSREKRWQEEMKRLREIAMKCELTEDFKWSHPCYTVNDKNVVLIHGFKDYCALLFFKGALLKDPEEVLIQQTVNSQAARQLRFKYVYEIEQAGELIRRYIGEAIELESAGAELEMKKTEDYVVPQELTDSFQIDPEFGAAFRALTPGRQRGYLLHFGGAKQSKTRTSRIEKAKPNIYEGKGYNER